MRIALTQAAYEARSIIASAQRAINLYPERNPDDSPVPFTHYPAPGLNLLISGSALSGAAVRATYRASNGDLYIVEGADVYYIDSTFTSHFLGSINFGTAPVSMSDNGLAIVIVDGSVNGWVIDMATRTFGTIPTGAPFYGANMVGYIDTFMFFNRPGTAQWYISQSDATYTMFTQVNGSITSGSTVGGSGYTNGTYTAITLTGGSGTGATGTFTVTLGVAGPVTIVAPGSGYTIGDTLSASGIGPGTGFAFQVETVGGAFDPLDIASKTGDPDPIVGIIAMHREIWVIGSLTTEIWYNAGAADFPFQAMPGAYIEHGCVAQNSICTQDLSVYWLSLDRQGQAIFVRGMNYQVIRVSNHAIENEWATYSTVVDAISFIYQQEGHTFIFVVFPSANKTWVYDQATELWHERAWTDNNGVLNRHRANCVASAYGKNIVGDWQNGNIYNFSLTTFTDNVDGAGLNPDGSYPISVIRGFPHQVQDGNRVSYEKFTADLQVGTDTGSIDGTSYPVGAILSGIITGGSGYTNGTYTSTAITGGSGVGAVATIVVSGHAVTSVTYNYEGQNYIVGDVLSASIPSGSGFTYTVTNITNAPTISLRWSDNRGASYGNNLEQSMGSAGQYLVQPKWPRLGLARDRVFELSWSTPTMTALNGAWINVTPASS